MSEKPKSSQASSATRTVTGVAWYRPDQYSQLLGVATDRSELDATYEEWEDRAKQALADLAKLGVSARRVEVDVNELVEWCRAERRPVDGAARAAFATLKLRETHREQPK